MPIYLEKQQGPAFRQQFRCPFSIYKPLTLKVQIKSVDNYPVSHAILRKTGTLRPRQTDKDRKPAAKGW